MGIELPQIEVRYEHLSARSLSLPLPPWLGLTQIRWLAAARSRRRLAAARSRRRAGDLAQAHRVNQQQLAAAAKPPELCAFAIDSHGWCSPRGEKRRKKMTCRARESVIGERAFNAIYVFVYTCSWAQVVFIRILWYFCEKRKIIMVCFEIDE